MSYLLEKSQVVTQKELIDKEEEYASYEKFEVDNHYIITDTKKPFFSIYDIAYYCKKKFIEDKLFLIVHRYFDSIRNEKITEFYIINSVDIFEDALMSVLSVSHDELILKQQLIQTNLKLAMKLLNCSDFHIILGDNIKLHEVLEYVLVEKKSNDNFEIFSGNTTKIEEFDLNGVEEFAQENVQFKDIRHSRISNILNAVRIIEPKNSKLKKIMILLSLVVISFFLAKDITDMVFESSVSNTKQELKRVQRELNKVRDNYESKTNESLNLRDSLKKYNQQEVFRNSQNATQGNK